MQAEQRAKISKDQFEPQSKLWQPFTVHGTEGEKRKKRRAFKTDKYVVVEDVDDGRVVLEVSAWPHIDRGGRLVFDGDPYEMYQDLGELQSTVATHRKDDGITGADRPVRIGDVFAVRGLHRNAKSLSKAETVRDISYAARSAAKAALFGAAASTVDPAYAKKMAIDEEPVKPRKGRGEFDVLQDKSRVELMRPGDTDVPRRSI